MRKYNKKLNEDITELKELHGKKDKTDFNRRKAEIMKSHGISKATVYREMKKEVPGSYKRPLYIPPIREVTAKEKEMVKGMLFRQIPIAMIMAEMEEQTGESYSRDRIDKIRNEIEKDESNIKAVNENAKRRGGKGKAGRKSKNEITQEKVLGAEGGGVNAGFEYESPHGEDMKQFLGKVLGIKNMDPRSILSIPVEGYVIKLGYDAVCDIQRKMANSAAGRGYDALEAAKINLKHLCIEQIRQFTKGKAYSAKDLIEINKILTQFESTGLKPGIDFEFLYDICMIFAAKGTRREDVVLVAANKAPEYKGLSNEMLANSEETNRALVKIVDENV